MRRDSRSWSLILGWMFGRGADKLADLTPVAAEAGAGAAEGDPRPVYTWAGPPGSRLSSLGSYTPFGGGPPRLVADVGDSDSLGVWDTGTGAFLGALECQRGHGVVDSLVTYQRRSDGRPRVAAG
jgi:hypothetical protein